ncbi:hypothetical protein ACIKTA_12995, partial [Hansschlegelia beijingensis]
GGGRHWGGGGRHWGGGWGRPGYYGRHRYYGHRHRYYGGYAAAGILGLAAGAALASPYYYDDDYYYGGPYYGYGYRRAYYGPECKVITRTRDRRGRPIEVIRYRPC